MRKILLMLSLVIVAMFLMGCTQSTEETTDVVDDSGAVVGQALKLPSGQVKITSGVRETKIIKLVLTKDNYDILPNGDLEITVKGLDTINSLKTKGIVGVMGGDGGCYCGKDCDAQGNCGHCWCNPSGCGGC